jgi:hypothetical protein
MSRSVSTALARAISRQQTDRAFLTLLDIDHPDRLPDLADTDLRGAWLNSEVTKTPNDYSTADDDMTAVGSPTWPAEGVTLDGATQHLKRSEAAWRPDAVGSVSAWVNLASVGAEQVIFSSTDEASNVRRLQLAISATNLLEVHQENNDVADVVEGDTVFAADAWRFVTLVSTGTAYVLYVDGLSETLTVTSGANGGDWLLGTTLRDNVMIGAYEELAGVSGDLDGTIRDVRYYSRALPSREIFSLYKAGLFAPIRVVDNTVNVHKGGNVYLPFPFQVTMPDEREDRMPNVQLRIDNVDKQIVDALRAIDTAPTVSLSVVLDSTPDVVEAGPFLFTLRRGTYDVNSVVGDLEYEDVLREPIPGDTFTPSNFPGVFAGVS